MLAPVWAQLKYTWVQEFIPLVKKKKKKKLFMHQGPNLWRELLCDGTWPLYYQKSFGAFNHEIAKEPRNSVGPDTGGQATPGSSPEQNFFFYKYSNSFTYHQILVKQPHYLTLQLYLCKTYHYDCSNPMTEENNLFHARLKTRGQENSECVDQVDQHLWHVSN